MARVADLAKARLMRASILTSFTRSENAAVAPTVALSLFALIAVGGIAFDYARMATLDTELQQAADQAALAAATQLDQQDDSITRATNAAQQLIENDTRFANDKDTDKSKITIPTANIKYYSAYSDDNDSTNDTETSKGAEARFVKVTTKPRAAYFALTPVVKAISANNLTGTAVAGVEGAVCGVVPFFICNPSEPDDNTKSNYPVDVTPGTGIKMIEGGDQKGPGNYGFLAFLGTGAKNLAEALSTDALYEDCTSATSFDTETGQKESVFDSLNRRFDLNATCAKAPCSTSTNERKDLVREAGSCNWKENPADDTNYTTRRYRPNGAALANTVTPEIMGHPRDICHATNSSAACSGSTNGLIGNGVWDRAAYFRSNHPGLDWAGDPDLGPNVTRYQTYLWEAKDAASRLKSKSSSTSGWSAYGTPQPGVCNYPGIDPNTGGIDRRRMTAAVVNCHAYGKINGKKTLPVAGFIDVFLVEPSLDRNTCDGNKSPCKTKITNRDDIYVEVIGASGTAEGGGTPQITRRTVPYLIQ